jgi:glutathione S-transferase
LFESRAICAYLDRAFEGPMLVPGDAAQAAGVEQWVSFAITAADPAIVRAYVLAYLFPGTPDGAPDPKRVAAALPALEKLLGVLDAQIGKAGYLAGASFTLADIYLVPMLAVANRLPESKQMLAGSANLSGYLQRQLARDSVKSTAPPPPPPKG